MRGRLTAWLVLVLATAASAQTTTTFTDRLVLADPPAKTSETACLWRDASTGMVATGACPTGTVTSVGLSLPGIFSVSGSPVTTSGTLTASLVSQTQNLVWASPNGSSGAPTFRSLVDADIPDNLTLGTVSGAPTFTGAATFGAAGTALSVTNNAAFGGIASSLVPSVTDTYNLGSSLRLWNEGFLSQINAVIYAEQTATLFGGWSIVGKNAGTFAAAVGAGDTSINFGKAMTNGHFIVVRAHDTGGTVRAEHMQITGTTGCTTCTVTRGLNTGGTGYAFAQGTSYLVGGSTGDGRIELRAYSTPQISVVEQGATYNAQTERVRIGYLDGAAGMGATTGKVGIVIGDASQYLRYYDGVLTIAGNGSGITSINGGNITTGTVTADKLNVTTLSAITANLGTVTAGTLTGTTIQTAASAPRTRIDVNGITISAYSGTGYQSASAVTWDGAAGGGTQALYSYASGATRRLALDNIADSGTDAQYIGLRTGAAGQSLNRAYLTLYSPSSGISHVSLCSSSSNCLQLSGVQGGAGGSILPSPDAFFTLGAGGNRFNNIHLNLPFGSPTNLAYVVVGDPDASSRLYAFTGGLDGTTTCGTGQSLYQITVEKGLVTGVACR